jgi:glycosyltransferase involved in cell wall biosynthesis
MIHALWRHEMHQLTFSVIIPLYNKERYIARAVRSVFAQNWQHYELLVVDDGSTDNGFRVLREQFQDPRIRLIVQENSGAGAARNRGLAEMRGDIAAFLDADDEWLPTHLRDIAETASMYPEAGLVATGFRAVYKRRRAFDHGINRCLPQLIGDYFRLATSGHAVHMSAIGVSRSLLERGVMFRQDTPAVEDQEFYTRAALHTSFAYHPRVSSLYHHDVGESAMATASWLARLPLVQSVCEMLREDIVPARLRESAAAYLAWIVEQHALAGLALGKRTEALSLLREANDYPISHLSKLRLGRLASFLSWTPSALAAPIIRFRRSRWWLCLQEFAPGGVAGTLNSNEITSTTGRCRA